MIHNGDEEIARIERERLADEERRLKTTGSRHLRVSGYGVPQELPPTQYPKKEPPPDLPKEIVAWLSQ